MVWVKKLPRKISKTIQKQKTTLWCKLWHNKELAEAFKIRIGGAFECLMQLEDIEIINELCGKLKSTTNNITKELAHIKRNARTKGLSAIVKKSWQKRRVVRAEIVTNPTNILAQGK